MQLLISLNSCDEKCYIYIIGTCTVARIGVHTCTSLLFIKKTGVNIAQLPSIEQTLELFIKVSIFFRLKLRSPTMVLHLQLIQGKKNPQLDHQCVCWFSFSSKTMKTVILVQITYSCDLARFAYVKGIKVLDSNSMFLKSRLCCYLKHFRCIILSMVFAHLNWVGRQESQPTH